MREAYEIPIRNRWEEPTMKTVLGVTTLLCLYALTNDASGAHDGVYLEIVVDKKPGPASKCYPIPASEKIHVYGNRTPRIDGYPAHKGWRLLFVGDPNRLPWA